MPIPDDIARRTKGLFGARLQGIFAFGSRISGKAVAASDLDLGVLIAGPMRRADTWSPWVEGMVPVK